MLLENENSLQKLDIGITYVVADVLCDMRLRPKTKSKKTCHQLFAPTPGRSGWAQPHKLLPRKEI